MPSSCWPFHRKASPATLNLTQELMLTKWSHIKVHLLVQSSITSYRFVHTCDAPENLSYYLLWKQVVWKCYVWIRTWTICQQWVVVLHNCKGISLSRLHEWKNICWLHQNFSLNNLLGCSVIFSSSLHCGETNRQGIESMAGNMTHRTCPEASRHVKTAKTSNCPTQMLSVKNI